MLVTFFVIQDEMLSEKILSQNKPCKRKYDILEKVATLDTYEIYRS